ncbi:MAG TPA: hypothetical protein VMR18_00810 [Candidatus Saccharimonadales bacterium]|nr:hypothetical protein [Candidatus Saccharimonadales bacterium]
MSNLDLYRFVWVIVIEDPAIGFGQENVVFGVYQSEETAEEWHEKLMNDEEKQKHVKYFIEQVPMYLDINSLEGEL